jgi:hypothetical protein
LYLRRELISDDEVSNLVNFGFVVSNSIVWYIYRL